MNLPPGAVKNGFNLRDAGMDDVQDYIRVLSLCLKKYIDENRDFFGEWNEETVANDFKDKMKRTSFQKLLLYDETVGFMAYDIKNDKIDGISINIIEKAQNNGIGSAYLSHIISLSKSQAKPIFLIVFKANPAWKLYERFGFKVYETQGELYMMTYTQTAIAPSKEYCHD